MQSKVMLSIVCVWGGAQNSISPRATKGLEPALRGTTKLLISLNLAELRAQAPAKSL